MQVCRPLIYRSTTCKVGLKEKSKDEIIEACVKTKTYVVFAGRKIGVYDRWPEANAQVNRFPGACYKGYDSREAAEEAFNLSVKQPVQVPDLNESSSSASTTAKRSVPRTNESKKLVDLLKELSDLGRENRNIGMKMEKLSEDIGKLLKDLEINSVP
ncbi:uncharacterized protein LOC142541411 isoform X2 [Primulina tabacum]|uniref:uncharacterized protein LOC142541411 isoform X2 n=1 Tax=Primulina tabacum TaxID=48773 RepID=UPI003F5A61EF